MKESVKIKLLFISLMLIVMSACAFAQQSGFDTNISKTRSQLKQLEKTKIKLDLSVFVDDQSIDDTSYVLNIVNYNNGVLTSMHVSNKFVLFLDYSTEYEISINYKNTNTKVIIVNTEATYNNWYIVTSVALTSGVNDRILAGGIKFDYELNTFKKYKN
jgi:hypothetical protein